MWRGVDVALIFVLNLAITTEKYGAVLILPSQSQSLIRQLVSYVLFNDIRTSHATQQPGNCGFLSIPAMPGPPRYGYENVV